MISSESNNSISTETWQPDFIALPIPENNFASTTQINVYITNNTRIPFRFNPGERLIPVLLTSNGQVLPKLVKANQTANISPSPSLKHRLAHLISNISKFFQGGEYSLVKARDTFSISINARIFWHNNSLALEFHVTDFRFVQSQNYWLFDTLHTGNYQLQFIYLTSSRTHKALLTTPYKNLRFVQPVETERNILELDNILFESIIPEKYLTIPRGRQAETSVKIGFRITNNTQNPIRFDLFATLIPEIVRSDGKILQKNYSTIRLGAPRESDFPLVLPGKSVTMFPSAKFQVINGDLKLKIDAGDGGGYWYIHSLLPGVYKLRFIYRKYSERGREAPTLYNQKITQSLRWRHKTILATPFVDISII